MVRAIMHGCNGAMGLAAVRQAQVEAYMKRKPFPKRQGTVELKDAILRL